jgi:hypothetical protein
MWFKRKKKEYISLDTDVRDLIFSIKDVALVVIKEKVRLSKELDKTKDLVFDTIDLCEQYGAENVRQALKRLWE